MADLVRLTRTQVLLVAAAGAAAPRLLRWAGGLISFAWRQLLRGSKDLTQYGEWAVVTGATDGIGRSYCDRFAEKGMNVLLVSRNAEKLNAAAAQIEAQWGVQCKYHAIDLVEAAAFQTDHNVWTRLQAVIAGLDIGLLVNNAGACYAYPELFAALDTDTLHDLPAINVASLVKMTHLVLPGMVERNRGAIVNVSSASAARMADGCPLVSLYAATKACVSAFSVALAAECRPAGVHVQVHSPGYVDTKMFVQPTGALTVTPDTFTRRAVRHIGFEDVAVPCVPHAIMTAALRAAPRRLYFWATWVNAANMRQQALREMQDGTRPTDTTGTLAGADSLPPDERRAVIRLDSRRGGPRV